MYQPGNVRRTGRTKFEATRPTQIKKPVSRAASQAASTRPTNKSRDIKIRFGNHPSHMSLYYPHSILKRRNYEDFYAEPFTDPLYDWHQPSNLDPYPYRSVYSPVRTPPRLRSILTSPGVKTYRNPYNLRHVSSPLPSLDWQSPLSGLDTWGIHPLSYGSNPDLSLPRRNPSPLATYAMGRRLTRQKKPYIVVPHLGNLISPPLQTDTTSPFIYPNRPPMPSISNIPRTYLHRIHSFTGEDDVLRPAQYDNLPRNDGFANQFVEDLIGRSIQDQLIPDILTEVINEIDQENKYVNSRPNRDRQFADLRKRLEPAGPGETHLFSDDWIRELDSQHHLAPASHRSIHGMRYRDLPAETQGRLLAEINQELIDYEIGNMARELSYQALKEGIVPVPNTYRRGYQPMNYAPLPMAESRHGNYQMDDNQSNAIDQQLKSKLVDNLILNQLLTKYIGHNGSPVDVDHLSRLLDATMLDNLVNQYQSIDENRSRTSDNYGAKKLHLNSFMNVPP